MGVRTEVRLIRFVSPRNFCVAKVTRTNLVGIVQRNCAAILGRDVGAVQRDPIAQNTDDFLVFVKGNVTGNGFIKNRSVLQGRAESSGSPLAVFIFGCNILQVSVDLAFIRYASQCNFAAVAVKRHNNASDFNGAICAVREYVRTIHEDQLFDHGFAIIHETIGRSVARACPCCRSFRKRDRAQFGIAIVSEHRARGVQRDSISIELTITIDGNRAVGCFDCRSRFNSSCADRNVLERQLLINSSITCSSNQIAVNSSAFGTGKRSGTELNNDITCNGGVFFNVDIVGGVGGLNNNIALRDRSGGESRGVT